MAPNLSDPAYVILHVYFILFILVYTFLTLRMKIQTRDMQCKQHVASCLCYEILMSQASGLAVTVLTFL